MKGIILGGGNGSRLYPSTLVTNKLLIPLYDKPLVYYPLATLMEAGIDDVLIISNRRDLDRFQMLFGDGSQLGMKISYGVQEVPTGIVSAFLIGADFIGEDGCALILGDNLFHGPDMHHLLRQASKASERGLATVFGYEVEDPERFGVAEVDPEGRVLSIEEKPKKPKSNLAVTGLYFYPRGVVRMAKKVEPSDRGEYEITDLNNLYLEEGVLRCQNLGNSFWYDAGTFDSLLEGGEKIKEMQKGGEQIAAIEAIAYRNGWISTEELRKVGDSMAKNSYGQYLLSLIK